MQLAPSLVYIIAFASLFGVVILQHVLRVRRTHVARASRWLTSRYLGWISFGWTQFWIRLGMSPLHIILLLLYTGANMFFVFFRSTSNEERQFRAAAAASANLALVMTGGRTNLVADAVGISLRHYYVIHRWVARLAIAEAAIHAGYAGTINWSSPARFGLIALILLSAIGISSVRPLRRSPAFFARPHVALALATLTILLIHAWSAEPVETHLEGKVALSTAAGLWAAGATFRWFRHAKVRAKVTKIRDKMTMRLDYFNKNPTPESGQGSIPAHKIRGTAEYLEQAEAHILRLCREDQKGYDSLGYTGAARIQVTLVRKARVYPGAYFYLFIEGWQRFRGVPMMAYYWPNSSARASELSFLVQDVPNLSAALQEESIAVKLDGPYGQNIQLERFNTIVLVAEGIGISAILPFAMFLATRRQEDLSCKRSLKAKKKARADETKGGNGFTRNTAKVLHRDSTRRITLIWVMDDSSHINWVQEQMSALAKLDPSKELLHIWIYEPLERKGEATTKLGIPEHFGSHWRVIHVPPDKRNAALEQQVSWELQFSAEPCALATCGKVEFTQAVRAISAEHSHTSFFELEYQPRSETPSVRGPQRPRKLRVKKPGAEHYLPRAGGTASSSATTLVADPWQASPVVELGRLRPAPAVAPYWEDDQSLYLFGHVFRKERNLTSHKRPTRREEMSIVSSVSEATAGTGPPNFI